MVLGLIAKLRLQLMHSAELLIKKFTFLPSLSELIRKYKWNTLQIYIALRGEFGYIMPLWKNKI